MFRRLFEEVVRQCVEKGLVNGRLMVTDSTHVKANASHASEYLVEVQEEPGAYWERLDRYEEEGLAELERRTGKRRKKRVKQIKRDKRRTHKRVSCTDPEAGHMNRPGKPRGQYYLSHQTTDTDHGIIIGVTVTPGDVYDSVPYLEHIHRNVIPIQAAAADSAYDFPLAHRVLEEQGIIFFVRLQSAHDRTKAKMKRDIFVLLAGGGGSTRCRFLGGILLLHGLPGLRPLLRHERVDLLGVNHHVACTRLGRVVLFRHGNAPGRLAGGRNVRGLYRKLIPLAGIQFFIRHSKIPFCSVTQTSARNFVEKFLPPFALFTQKSRLRDSR